MSTKETTQRTTGLLTETLEDCIDRSRDWMQQTSPVSELIMGYELTNGEVITCLLAGVILFLAMLAAHLKEYGWAVACAGMAINMAKPIIRKISDKEGGRS